MPASAATDRLLEGLNEPQRDAVLHGDGPLLILAGAGSGKTRVLTHRIAHLVGSGRARHSEILAITFTNKSAQEMRERVEALVGGRARAMWVMTFHSACARMLRADAERLGYTRGFTIYDEQDSLRLVKNCVDELDVDPKRFAPRGIRRQISDAKNQLLDAEAYRIKVSSFFEQTAADVYELYEQRLHSANAMDFDDLLFRCVNLFELFPEVLERYRRGFRHVLVDEYQDTNRAQYRRLQLLCEEHRSLCVVGDDDQSVYAFRGADIKNILDFEHDYPDAEVVKLEQNYRSTQTILNASNAVISNNRARKAKSLWSDLGDGEPVHVRELRGRARRGSVRGLGDRAARGRGRVARRDRRLLPDQRSEPGARGHAGPLRRQLPGDRRHALLRASRSRMLSAISPCWSTPPTASPSARGERAQARHREHLPGAHHELREHAGRAGVGRSVRAGEDPGLGTAAVKAVGRFMSVMERLRERVDGGAGVGDLLAETLEETGYTDALRAERTVESQVRLENLEELVGVAREYDAVAEEGSVEEFLQQIALFSEQDNLSDEQGIVTLMTLHNAKGLEYGTVFIIGLEDGVFPHMRSIESGDLEEERRLAYVGITRAKRQLYLTHARTRALFGNRD